MGIYVGCAKISNIIGMLDMPDIAWGLTVDTGSSLQDKGIVSIPIPTTTTTHTHKQIGIFDIFIFYCKNKLSLGNTIIISIYLNSGGYVPIFAQIAIYLSCYSRSIT